MKTFEVMLACAICLVGGMVVGYTQIPGITIVLDNPDSTVVYEKCLEDQPITI